MTSFGSNTTRNHPFDRRMTAMAEGIERMERRQRLQNAIVGVLLLTAIVAGCANKIQGGEARKEIAAFRATVQSPDGHVVKVSDDRDRVATTQPTVTTWGNVLPQIGEARLGDIGSVSIKQAAKNWPLALPVGLIFLAAAFVYWRLLGQPIVAVLCGAMAVLSFFAPTILIWGAVAVVAYVLLTQTNVIKRLVNSGREVLEMTPPDRVEPTKAAMSKAQDDRTRKVVRKVRGKS